MFSALNYKQKNTNQFITKFICKTENVEET